MVILTSETGSMGSLIQYTSITGAHARTRAHIELIGTRLTRLPLTSEKLFSRLPTNSPAIIIISKLTHTTHMKIGGYYYD
jgi:hypothetical protein